MHKPVIPTLAAATFLFAAFPDSSRAQVTTSQSALDALGPSGHPASPHHAPARGKHAQAAAKPGHGPQKGGKHGGPVPANAPAATIPSGPPAAPVFTAPVVNVPLHPPAPPPPVPVVQNATGVATPIPDGVRIGFGAGSNDLNPATMQALHDFSARLKAAPEARASLDAAAVGSPDDPSTPRRLALSRGLAARAVLINDGITSTRIYVRMDPNAKEGGDEVALHLQSNADGGSAAPTPPPGASQQAPAAGPAAPGHAQP